MSDWKPLSDTPPYAVAVWVYCDDGMRHIARLTGTEWNWKTLRYVKKWELLWPEWDRKRDEKKLITHWMPLPDPPEENPALHPVTLTVISGDKQE
jgi:hypothetical protein